jgi:hypothetical protein
MITGVYFVVVDLELSPDLTISLGNHLIMYLYSEHLGKEQHPQRRSLELHDVHALFVDVVHR